MQVPHSNSLSALVGNGIEFPFLDTTYIYSDSGWGSSVGVSGDTGFVTRIFKVWDSIIAARKIDSITKSVILKKEVTGRPYALIKYTSGYRKVISDSAFRIWSN